MGTVYTSFPWMSSTEEVKSEISCGLSANATMKNSSCGLAVLKNSITASRARSILLAMLPLMSKDDPDRYRSVFAGEMADILLRLCLQKLKILFVQTRDQTVQGIRDRHRYENQVDLRLERLGMGLQRWIDQVVGIGLGRLNPRRNVNIIDREFAPTRPVQGRKLLRQL